MQENRKLRATYKFVEMSMASPQSSAASVAAPLRSTSIHHLHVAGEVCPVCDQPIPHDRAEEVGERLEARECEQSAAISAQLRETFDTEKAEAVERVRLETAEKVAAAREEARRAAEAQSKAHIDTAEQARAAAQEALRLKTEEAEEAKAGAETAQAALQKAEAEAVQKGAAIRSEATRIASEAAAAKIAEAEASKARTEQANAALQDQLDVVKRDSQATLEKVKAEAAARMRKRRFKSSSRLRIVMLATTASRMASSTKWAMIEVQSSLALPDGTRDVNFAGRSTWAFSGRAREGNEAKAPSSQRSLIGSVAAVAEQSKLHGGVRHRQRQRRLVGGDDIDFERLSRAVYVSERYSSFHDRCSQNQSLKCDRRQPCCWSGTSAPDGAIACVRRSRRTENAID
jgi:hypothetical protein